MRILFVCGSPGGGAAMSTRELVDRVCAAGNVAVVLERSSMSPRSATGYKRLTNLAVHLRSGWLRKPIDALAGRIGATASPGIAVGHEYLLWTAGLLQNAALAVMRETRPDIVVVNSVDPLCWQKLHKVCEAEALPVALYLREESSLYHLTNRDVRPDLVIANAYGLAREAVKLGHDAVVVPSVVDVASARTTVDGRRVLYINPIRGYGVERALAIARACPDIQFAFQESWKIPTTERTELEATIRTMANIELRGRVDDVKMVYRDALALLVPFTFNTRPRVVLEAQTNGIPVLSTDTPSLAEAVGEGGSLLGSDAPIEDWVQALRMMLEPERHPALGAAARIHAGRDDVNPERIVRSFEAAIREAISRHSLMKQSSAEGSVRW